MSLSLGGSASSLPSFIRAALCFREAAEAAFLYCAVSAVNIIVSFLSIVVLFRFQSHNQLLKPRSGAKIRASTGQSNRWLFCAFASLIVAQKNHQFACRLARRYITEAL